MDKETQAKWDKIYASAEAVPAMAVVKENLHLLPEQGVGLELACGLAANSMLLAEHGIDMEAWDISPVAIARVNDVAREKGLNVLASARDVISDPPADKYYDLVVVSHFLDRTIVPAIMAVLKPGGLLFYQTFTRTRVGEGGPGNSSFRLADNELLELFSGLKVLVYREEGLVGDTGRGFRDEAMLVAQKN